MKNKFRVALIGCGAISGNHIAGILESGHDVCALCDVDEKKAKSAIEKFGLHARIYADHLEMLDIEHPGAVHICTPHYLHAQMCIAALKRGIHVLCEKPLCINRGELEQIVAAAKASCAQVGVCLQNRYEPNLLKLKELSEGKVKAALGIVAWQRDADYYTSGEWRGKWATEGGGVMINQALHTLDLLQWIAGMPVSVTAHLGNDHLKDVIEVEDTATALFETADGRRLNFFATTACGVSFPAQLHIGTVDHTKLYADNGSVTENGVPLRIADHNGTTIGKSVWGNGHRLLIADFYRHIAEGTPFPIDAEEGGKVIRLILSMYESNGKKIAIY